jgi:hypothetical protein
MIKITLVKNVQFKNIADMLFGLSPDSKFHPPEGFFGFDPVDRDGLGG